MCVQDYDMYAALLNKVIFLVLFGRITNSVLVHVRSFTRPDCVYYTKVVPKSINPSFHIPQTPPSHSFPKHPPPKKHSSINRPP